METTLSHSFIIFIRIFLDIGQIYAYPLSYDELHGNLGFFITSRANRRWSQNLFSAILYDYWKKFLPNWKKIISLKNINLGFKLRTSTVSLNVVWNFNLKLQYFRFRLQVNLAQHCMTPHEWATLLHKLINFFITVLWKERSVY